MKAHGANLRLCDLTRRNQTIRVVLGPRRLDGLEARRALVLRVVEDLVVLAMKGSSSSSG